MPERKGCDSFDQGSDLHDEKEEPEDEEQVIRTAQDMLCTHSGVRAKDLKPFGARRYHEAVIA